MLFCFDFYFDLASVSIPVKGYIYGLQYINNTQNILPFFYIISQQNTKTFLMR